MSPCSCTKGNIYYFQFLLITLDIFFHKWVGGSFLAQNNYLKHAKIQNICPQYYAIVGLVKNTVLTINSCMNL